MYKFVEFRGEGVALGSSQVTASIGVGLTISYAFTGVGESEIGAVQQSIYLSRV